MEVARTPEMLLLLLLLTSGECVNVAKKVFKLWKSSKMTATPGVWGEWGAWNENCSTTCGIGVRRRVRTCSYTGPKRKLRCKGNVGQLRNCDTHLTCPVHGGWATWVAWDCSVSCGGGVGLQKRTCTRPKPMFGGKGCEGPSEDDGKCNMHKCADQVYTLSPATFRDLKAATEKVQNAFQPQEGSNVHLTCNPKVVAEIFREYPSSVLLWTKNGRLLTVDVGRAQVGLTELQVLELRTEDSGVYVCSMRYAPGVVKPVSVAAVAVRPLKPNVQPRTGERLQLLCHGAQLGTIYKNLTQSWWYGKQLHKNFGNASLVENDVYVIEETSPNMTGMWTCQIQDPKRGWTWTTNKVSVNVLPAIPLYLRLLQDWNFWLGFCTLVFITLVTLGTFLGYKVTKARESFLTDFEKWCHIVHAEDYRTLEDKNEDNEEDISEDNDEDISEDNDEDIAENIDEDITESSDEEWLAASSI